jgi:hypothetical protein
MGPTALSMDFSRNECAVRLLNRHFVFLFVLFWVTHRDENILAGCSMDKSKKTFSFSIAALAAHGRGML